MSWSRRGSNRARCLRIQRDGCTGGRSRVLFTSMGATVVVGSFLQTAGVCVRARACVFFGKGVSVLLHGTHSLHVLSAALACSQCAALRSTRATTRTLIVNTAPRPAHWRCTVGYLISIMLRCCVSLCANKATCLVKGEDLEFSFTRSGVDRQLRPRDMMLEKSSIGSILSVSTSDPRLLELHRCHYFWPTVTMYERFRCCCCCCAAALQSQTELPLPPSLCWWCAILTLHAYSWYTTITPSMDDAVGQCWNARSSRHSTSLYYSCSSHDSVRWSPGARSPRRQIMLLHFRVCHYVHTPVNMSLILGTQFQPFDKESEFHWSRHMCKQNAACAGRPSRRVVDRSRYRQALTYATT